MNDGLRWRTDEYFGEVNIFYQQAEIDLTTLPTSAFDLSVTYQGCADAGLCYPPETIDYRIDPATGTVSLKDNSASAPSAAAK